MTCTRGCDDGLAGAYAAGMHPGADPERDSGPAADPGGDADADWDGGPDGDLDDAVRVDSDLSLDPSAARLLTALLRLDPAQARAVRTRAARARPRPQSGPLADYGAPDAG